MGIIRLLLAIAVFNSHFPFLDMPVVDGHEAVLAFFAISGFYMALILDTTYTSTKSFYVGRFLSLYPIYIFATALSVALLVTWDVHPMTGLSELKKLLADPMAFIAMLWTSAFVFGQELLFCLSPSPDGGLHIVEASRHAIWKHAPLIQAWSLSLEITFYALAPLLVRLKTRTLGNVVAASIVVKLMIMNGAFAETVFFKRFFPAEFWLFGCGILAYRFYRTLPRKSEAVDFFAFLLLAGFIFIVGDVERAFEPFALPAATLITLPFIFRGFRSVRIDREIGKISYPFYLLHFSAIAIFEAYWDEPEGWHILIFALAAALLTHSIFNPGIELLKNRMRTAKQPLMPEVAVMSSTIPRNS